MPMLVVGLGKKTYQAVLGQGIQTVLGHLQFEMAMRCSLSKHGVGVPLQQILAVVGQRARTMLAGFIRTNIAAKCQSIW